MNKPSKNELAVPTRRQALRVSRMIGCEGAHQDTDGNWMPCSSHEKLSGIIGDGKKSSEMPKKRHRKRVGTKPRDFERLTERGVLGIQTLAGGGLVSSPVSVKTDQLRSKVGSFLLLSK